MRKILVGKGCLVRKAREMFFCYFATQHARTKHARYGSRAVMMFGRTNLFGYTELVRARVAHQLRQRVHETLGVELP